MPTPPLSIAAGPRRAVRSALAGALFALAVPGLPAFAQTVPQYLTGVAPGLSHVTSMSHGESLDGTHREFLIKNGRLYLRDDTADGHAPWSNATGNITLNRAVGDGDVTAFGSTRYPATGHVFQTLVRGGEIWRRESDAKGEWGNWNKATAYLNGVGAGRITDFSVVHLGDGMHQHLVRGGRVHTRVLSGGTWSAWTDITAQFDGVGNGGVLTGYGMALDANGNLREYLVRNHRGYARVTSASNAIGLPKWVSLDADINAAGRSPNARAAAPIYKRVMVIDYDPIINTPAFPYNKRLHAVGRGKPWVSGQVQQDLFIADIEAATKQVVQYSVVKYTWANEFPRMKNGFRYTADTYMPCMLAENCYDPNDWAQMLDYNAVIAEHNVCTAFNNGEIDELWIWGGPYFRFRETNMAGTGAFWTNGEVITGTDCQGKLNIFGFNYERGTAEMFENMGHRVEGTMEHFYAGTWRNRYRAQFGEGEPDVPMPFPSNPNMLELFTVRGFDAPAASACGNAHGSLNAVDVHADDPWDYDSNTTTPIASTCEDWENYPGITHATTLIGCDLWNCTRYGSRRYFVSKVPAFSGRKNRVIQGDGDTFLRNSPQNFLRNNWWHYVLDWDDAVTP